MSDWMTVEERRLRLSVWKEAEVMARNILNGIGMSEGVYDLRPSDAYERAGSDMMMYIGREISMLKDEDE